MDNDTLTLFFFTHS